MSTTSLKLPDDLKQLTVAAAQKLGVSPHAFMVQAIEQAATSAERRAGFVADAKVAREQMLSTSEGFDAGEVHTYLKARIAGERPTRPKARPWRS